MDIARLIGNVWATRKYESMSGLKLMLVECELGKDKGKQYVAVDTIGAGIGDRVIVTKGSSAKNILEQERNKYVPVDAIIVGIIDDDCQLWLWKQKGVCYEEISYRKRCNWGR